MGEWISGGIRKSLWLLAWPPCQYLYYTCSDSWKSADIHSIQYECIFFNSRLQLSSQTVPVSPEHLSVPLRICPAHPPSASFSSAGPSAPPPAATGETVSPQHSLYSQSPNFSYVLLFTLLHLSYSNVILLKTDWFYSKCVFSSNGFQFVSLFSIATIIENNKNRWEKQSKDLFSSMFQEAN